MSRIGKLPIVLPKGVEVKVEPGRVCVKGPKGELSQNIDSGLLVAVDGDRLTVTPKDGDKADRAVRGQHGLARTLINNMVIGVTNGFKVTLDIKGVGYRVAANGKGLTFSLGYSHPINIPEIPGIEFELQIEARTKINRVHIKGIDKQKVGQVAADLRSLRPPEPYKGKGVRYLDEVIILKAGKAGKTGK